MNNLFLFLLSLALANCFAPSQDQGFLSTPKKLFKISLKEESTQVTPKQIFDFLTTKQTYFKKSQDYSEFDMPVEHEEEFTQSGPSNIRLYNFKNTQFTGSLSIGKEENEFKVIFDTGSANLWIDSTKCKNDGCKQHKQYNSRDSYSYNHLGTGELNGEVNQDKVFVGGIELEQQDFAEIVEENGAVFSNSGFDGIVGLAYPKMAAYNFNPLFDNIIKSEKLESNQFSFYLSAKEGSQESQITFGGVDDSLLDGPVHYHHVIDQYYWMVKAQNILVDGKDVGLCPHGCKVIADTGTSLITGPTDDLLKLLDLADVDERCNNIAQLPTLDFVIDDQHYVLTPDDYVMQMFDNGMESPFSQATSASFIEGGSQSCIGAFMPLDIPDPQGPSWILGDVFLTKYYSVYDRDINSVGFALAKH